MKRNIMLLLCGAALTASAQTDVTADYLTHYDFDSGFHHKAGATTEVKQEIKTITGWTAGFTVDYTITGIYEYGFAGTFNGGEVPSKGYQNSEGGALALSTGWGVAMTYSQNVTLPAGTYTINVPTYNGKSASMALFNNPVMSLTEEQQKVCALDFDYIKRRLALTTHNFHRDAMINAIQCMIIDFFDFHASLYGNEKITSQYAELIERFMALLERGDYRKNREINYYADKLFVTSKYLSEVCKKVSGFPANYRINRYTVLDISRQLRDRKKTLTALADAYNFSSPGYFSRYVQKYLGIKPTDFRE